MSETIQVKVGEDVHEVEGRMLNIVCKSKDVLQPTSYPGRFPLTPETSLYHGDRVTRLHAKTEAIFRLAFPQWPFEFKPEVIRQLDVAPRQVLGMIDLALKLTDMKVPLALLHPENGLHPGVQVNLGDVVIALSKYIEGAKP